MFKEKPTAPDTLNSDERVIWEMVIGCHQWDWLLDDQLPVLIAYCRHTVAADRLSKKINKHKDIFLEADVDAFLKASDIYLELLDAHGRESEAILAAATTLRITHQAKFEDDRLN